MLHHPAVPAITPAVTDLTHFIHQLLQPGEVPVIVGYNSSCFDWRVLRGNLMAVGAADVPEKWLTLDALVLVRKMQLKKALQLPDVKQGEGVCTRVASRKG
jgi:precorrin-4 methylase